MTCICSGSNARSDTRRQKQNKTKSSIINKLLGKTNKAVPLCHAISRAICNKVARHH